MQALTASGYTEPTPVQARAIPEAVAGHDLMVSAPTGTGKTAAFVLPALTRIAQAPKPGRGPRVLVLTPTRELALQVTSAVEKYSKFMNRVRTGTVLGGGVTTVGSDGLYMVGSHVAHDCVVGDKVTFANNATLAGHVTVGDFVFMGGLCAVHQFSRIGRYAFVGGGANSDQWSQIHADVLGREIRQVADPVLANVRGAAILTLLALDRIALTDVPAMVEVKRTYRPDPANAAEYDLLFAEFVTLYKQTKGIFKRLNRF